MATALEKKLGQRVSEFRKTLGMPQSDLADRVGVTVDTISRLERGASVPSVARLESIAKALGVEVVHLFEVPQGERRRRPGSDKRARTLKALMDDLEPRTSDELALVHDIVSKVLRFADQRPKRRRGR